MTDLDAFLEAEMARGVERLRQRKPRAPRVTAPVGSERDHRKAMVAYLRKCGCITHSAINEVRASSRDKNERARFWNALVATGSTKGSPDLIVDPPHGPIFYLEVKKPGGRVRDAQTELHANLRLRGRIVIVAYDLTSLQYELAQAGISLTRTPLRRATPVEPLTP